MGSGFLAALSPGMTRKVEASIPALRSFLFAPGNHARRVEKALSLDADAVILDLEDAVAIAEKPATRGLIAEALTRQRTGLLYVRVNAVDTEFCYGDLVAVVQRGLDGIILPKVETAAGLLTVDWLLTQLERERGLSAGNIDLIPIIETAKRPRRYRRDLARRDAASNASRSAPATSRSTSTCCGAATEAELAYARAKIVTASRAAGIEAPLDTVWVDLADSEGLGAIGAHGARPRLPGQDVHPPGAGADREPRLHAERRRDRIRREGCRRLRRGRGGGVASIQLDGKFIDYPIVYRARRVLQTVAEIRARDTTP